MPSRASEHAPFSLTFPSSLTTDQVVTWLRAVSGTVQTGPRRLLGIRVLVFEVRATDRGISHRLLLPRESVDFVVPQLRSLVPGSTVTPAAGVEPPDQWTTAVELASEIQPVRSL
jgi:hypothetical protein